MNERNASAASGRPARPMPIFAGFKNSRRNGNGMDRRIGETGDRRFCRFIPFLICVIAFGLASVALAQNEEQEPEPTNAKPDADRIVIEPSGGKIGEGDQITITFPQAMVAPDLIDVGNQAPPFVSEPKLD